MSDLGLRSRFDPGFSRKIAWDIDLLGGYEHQFIDVRTGLSQDSFLWLRLKPGFGDVLRRLGARALWVQGWQVAAYWQAVWEARRIKADVWLRGDTNLRSSRQGVTGGIRRYLLKHLLSHVNRFFVSARPTTNSTSDRGFRRIDSSLRPIVSTMPGLRRRRLG